MGFGFNLIGFPLLLVLTLGLLLYFIFSKDKRALWTLGAMWGLVLLLFMVGSLRDRLARPMALSRGNIMGEYRIDTSFYPGANARWQYQHFGFELREGANANDSIVFVEMQEGHSQPKVYRHPIKYVDGPTLMWRVDADSTSHVLAQPPTLYRSHSQFYYVFHSAMFGNMFFRKVEN